MRKIDPIRSGQEFSAAVKETLRDDKDLSWRLTSAEQIQGQPQADAIVHLNVGGKDLTFLAEFKLKLTADIIESLSDRSTPRNHPWLLVTPRLTEHFVELCRKYGVACLDLNGRVWIRRGTVLIDRSPRENPEPIIAAARDPDLFSAKSSRVVRALLSPRSTWTQGELASEVGISRPQLSRLLDSLTAQGFVRREGSKRGGQWRVLQPDSLLDEWARKDVWSRRAVVHQYSLLVPTLDQGAQQVMTAFGSSRLAFTQWFAAQLRHPYTEAPVLSAYIESFPSENILKTLKARKVDSGGRLWLILPQDEGVFQFTNSVGGLPLVSDAQIYLDLLRTGLRGPDAAEALRQWEGFRR